MERNVQMAAKLAVAGIGLMLAVVLLAVGTFAWFTVNTRAEVNGITVSFVNDGTQWPFEFSMDYREKGYDEAAATWAKEINISELFEEEYKLRPISTSDLVHWYGAKYDANGNVAAFQEVPLQTIANQKEPAEGERVGTNCVIYVDVWVRTRDPNTNYDLKLNNPGLDTDGKTLKLDEGETNFGTYVLWTPVWTPDEDSKTGGQYSAASANDAMASIRVGFSVSDQDGRDIENEQFRNCIFEPNADLHNGLGEKAENEALRYLTGTTGSEVVKDHAAPDKQFYQDKQFYETYVPQFRSDHESYTMTVQQTIQQSASSWNEEKLRELNIGELDSTCIGAIGTIQGDATIASNVERGKPRMIRIYFWLEGQDVDCWNQIKGGSLYANLEFRGDAAAS